MTTRAALRAFCLLMTALASVSIAQRPVPASGTGAAFGSARIGRIQLLLRRTPEQEHALEALLDDQQTPQAPGFHQWLGPTDFGVRFGPPAQRLDDLRTWLVAQGFTDIHVNVGRTVVEFSGTAAAIDAAFGTSLEADHRVDQRSLHTSLTSARIPSAIADVVGPIVTRSGDAEAATAAAAVRGRAGVIGRLAPSLTLPSNNTTYYGITPYDFAAIYNVLPLWNATTPIDGTGQTIAVVGDTDINPADFVAFRKLFHLPLGDTSSQTGTQYLNIIYNGPKPSVRPDEFHAASDTQWASAAARGATIDYVASESTEASSGLDLSAAYVVDNNLASILVDSYATCELALGTSGNMFYKALWQQAAAQGITVVTASGDSAAAGCDGARVAPATGGAAVNGVGSTPYNVSVGGTDFHALSGLGTYFGTNASTYGSATGYIPEAVWNDTCTNPDILALPPFVGLTAAQACNSAAARSANLAVAAGSGGGPSSCTASNGSTAASCSGGYLKPAWQIAPGVPTDGLRDTPDISLFASQGRSNAFYVVCQQSRDVDGRGCNLDYPYADFAAYGGTEVAAPAFAGILALAAQKANARLGNPNPILYKLAAAQARSGVSCDASNSPSSACIFHDVTLGTNAVPCVAGSLNCSTAAQGDAVGILNRPAAGVGYDLATGLGSVDANNLVQSWAAVSSAAASAVLSIYPSKVVHGAAVTAQVTVTGASPTGDVAINSQAANGSVGAGPLSGGLFSQTFRTFPGGTYGVQAHYAGDAQNGAADSNFVSITVLAEPSTTSLQTLNFDPATGTAVNVTSAPYGSVFYIRSSVIGQSGEGNATGNIALTDNAVIFGSGVYRLNSSGYTEAQNNSIVPGGHLFAANYSGDASFDASLAPSASLTITRAPTAAMLRTSPQTVSAAATVTLSAVLNTHSYGFAAPSGTVTFVVGTQVLGTTALVAGSDRVTFQRNATASLTIAASALPVGLDSLTVSYPGDTNYLASSSGATVISVTPTNLNATQTTVAVTPSTVAPSGTITFSAAVSPSAPVPTGAIQFVVDGQDFGVPIPLTSSARATLATSVAMLTMGPHNVLAVYSGDAAMYRSSSSSSAPFLIGSPGIPSVPAFVATPRTAVQGTFISVAATVMPQPGSGSTATPTGTVQLVLDGGSYGAPVPLNQAAASLPLITGTLQAGPHVLTVFYSGDGVFAPAYALPATLVIAAPGVRASTVILTGLPPQISLGNAASFTASVSPTNPTPSGIFQASVDGGNPGAPILLAGAATVLSIPSSSLPLGRHTVSVFYSGDAIYNFATSSTASFTVLNTVPGRGFSLSPAARSITGPRSSPFGPMLYTVTPTGGFDQPVTFVCGHLPAFTSCTFQPNVLLTAGVENISTTLTFNLNTGVAPVALEKRSSLPMVFVCVLVCLLPLGRRRARPVLFALLLAVLLGLGMTGCESNYTFGTTPSGTYNVAVTASGGGIDQTATLSLTIQ